MIKIVAIANFYTDASWRVGLLDKREYPDTKTTVIIPSSVARKNAHGYNKLLQDGFTTKHFKSIFNFHHSVRLYLPQLYIFLHHEKPDIIFVTNEPWSLTAFQIVLWCKIFLKKTKIIVYTSENQTRKYPLPFPLIEKFVLNNVDQVISVTEIEGIGILQKKGYSGKIVYMPLSVDTSLYKKLAIFDSIIKLKLPEGKIVLGFVGRLVKEKGIQTLIDALALLGNNFHALIIGDGPYKNELLNHAKLKNVFNNITFTGSINYDDLPIYYNRMNVFVLPSLTTYNWKEQFGRVLIEAMACEVTVVGSSSGEIPTVIGDSGVVFNEGNADSLANAVLKALKCSSEYAARGKERVQINFSKKVVDSITYKNYIDLLKIK
ncbi:MAG: glycosyltransferase family 4 protein [Endomicrobiales bacterium]|nr:glycosyltransferase family 4 protein [Endomicrobiales bacterium]